MTADCQACAAGIGSIPQPLVQSKRNVPLGACWNCSCFACAHHGQRDSKKAQYWCAECDRQLLVASALGSGVSPAAADVQSSIRADAATLHQLLFDSVEDFRQRRPGYGEQMLKDAHRMQLSLSYGDREESWLPKLLEGLDPDSDRYRFLVLSGLIGRDLVIPEERMPDYQRQIQNALTDGNHDR